MDHELPRLPFKLDKSCQSAVNFIHLTNSKLFIVIITSNLVRMLLKYLVFDPICVIFCVTVSTSVLAASVEMDAAAPISGLELPLPSTELNGHCQESCTIECCKLPLFNPGDISLNTAARAHTHTHSSFTLFFVVFRYLWEFFYAFIKDFNSRKMTGEDPRQTLTRDTVVHGRCLTPKPQVHLNMFLC